MFLCLGGVYVLGLWPDVGRQPSPICTAHGGFTPNGMLPVLTGAVAATGFYFGAEIVTIAAAEVGRARQGGGAGDPLGDHARAGLLRGLDSRWSSASCRGTRRRSPRPTSAR